ncbi:terminase small subunit [Vibrio metschnikovii]|nr:terminase small subunit [Vibrio metschnikovii]
MSKLTDKQEMFCREYLIDLNATQAAIRAGYSEKTAKETGYENLTKPHIADRITELKSQRVEDAKISANYVLNRLVEIDKMDVIDITNDDGSLKPISQWPKVWRTTLSGLDVAEIIQDGSVAGLLKKIKLPDKVKNLELLGRHVEIQAWKDKVEIEASENMTPWGLIKAGVDE